MKKKLLSLCLCTLAVAMTLPANADLRLTHREKYGDHMGISANCQAKDFYFYDANGDTVRHVFQTAGTSGVFDVENVYYYNYNEQGQLTSLVNYKWRPAYSDWKQSDSIAYNYDDNGNRIEEIGGRDTYRFTYDENGNITKREQIVTYTGMVIQTIVYSDFIEGAVNKPRKYSADGQYSNYVYDGTIEYDAQNRVIVDKRYTSSGSKMQTIEYAYDELGVCVSEKWYTSPSWTPETIVAGSEADTLMFSKNIKRTALGNNWYHYQESNYVAVDFDENFNNIYAWSDASSSYKECYAEISADKTPRDIQLFNVSTADSPNTVKITALEPANAPANAKYIIWRNWEIAGIVAAADGVIEYEDAGVESRVHTYFIQSYDEVANIYYNVTNLTDINMSVALAAVKDIRLVAGRQEVVSDAMTGATYDSYIITIEWDAPVCDYEVKSYEIYQKPFAMPIATVAGDVLTTELNMPDEETADIRIDAVYDLGTVEGEYYTFTWDRTKDFGGEQTTNGVLTLVKDDDGGEASVYLYDANNNLSRVKNLMYSSSSTDYLPNYQYYYNYVNGLLDEYYFIQYKDMGEWSAPKNQTFYEYDEQGRLISEENIYTYNDYFVYKYDEQGRLVGYTRYGKTNRNSPDATYDKVYHTVTYSDFDENNQPRRMDYEDALYASGTYFVLYTYDERGNVLIEEAWKPDLNSTDESARIPYYKYENKYDENNINIERIKSNNNWEGGFIYASKEVREKVSDNVYQFTLFNYVEYTQEWSERSAATETYAVLDGEYAPRALKADKINNVNFTNAVQLTCNVPVKEVPNAQYIVWYDWEPVDTIAAVDGKITYIAENLPNGRDIEFVIQSYDPVNDVVYNASNVAVANYTVELPVATGLKYDSTTLGTFKDGQGGTHPAYWVHFSWNAPETDLEILGYNVYEQGWTVPYTFTTNTNDSLSVYRETSYDSPDQIKEVGIEIAVVYSIGESERIVEVFTVENVAVDVVEMATRVYVAGDYLVVGDNAEVVIYNAAGALMGQYNNMSRVALDALNSGVYVARVKIGNTVQTVKFSR